ncbi:YajG family lipoprotein [Desulfosediminicola flagellatus]|uniref:YajG family lipoprotein n=1 Tax=Desulfosediminicola flagellatus TaxID=2569541 RepID=UPI00142EE78D|nr:YajG family lipoprotein [Desulfosediminicola flagellatus]
MKKLALLICILLLAGCESKRPATAKLSLNIARNPSTIYAGSSATIRGEDSRMHPEIVEFKIGDDPILRVPSLTPPHALITKQLADGFLDQGMTFTTASEARILLNIKELLVTVTKPKMLYQADAKSRITLQITNGSATLTKKYDRETSKESATRPKIPTLENMLNNQLKDIIEQILEDEDIRSAILSK